MAGIHRKIPSYSFKASMLCPFFNTAVRASVFQANHWNSVNPLQFPVKASCQVLRASFFQKGWTPISFPVVFPLGYPQSRSHARATLGNQSLVSVASQKARGKLCHLVSSQHISFVNVKFTVDLRGVFWGKRQYSALCINGKYINLYIIGELI